MADQISNKDIVGASTNAAAGLIAGETYGRKLSEQITAVHQFNDKSRPYRLRENGDIEVMERLADQPTWRRGDVTFHEALSFARFVKRFRNGQTIVFADVKALRFTAALDYHPGLGLQSAASWDLFRAMLPLLPTPSWIVWTGASGQPMAQVAFAQFLEDNIPDIADPAGATLVEIARTLEAKIDVQYESHVRVDNGSHRFTYREDVSGTSAGSVVIPAEITLALQPFEGSKVYPVKARFRYRVSAKQVSMWFDLVRVQDVLTSAFADELMKISGELGDTTPIYNGPAPAAQTPAA